MKVTRKPALSIAFFAMMALMVVVPWPAFGQGGPLHLRMAEVVPLPAPNQVIAWGDNNYYSISAPSTVADVLNVAAGSDHAVAILADGSVVGWGNESYFDYSNMPNSDVSEVAAGRWFDMALLSNGTVSVWGNPVSLAVNYAPSLSGIVAVAAGAGGDFALALNTSGVITVWGDNTDGEVKTAPTGSGFVAISAGETHAAALRSNGSLVMWGDNYYGECNIPVGLTNIVAVSCGGYYTLALKSDGTVVAWGDGISGTINVPSGLSDVVEISAGGDQVMARTADGRIIFWGGNLYYGPNWFGVDTDPTANVALMVRSGGDFNVVVVDPNRQVSTTLALSVVKTGTPVLTVTGLSGIYGVYSTPNLSLPFSNLIGQVTISNSLPVVFQDTNVTKSTRKSSRFYRTVYQGGN